MIFLATFQQILGSVAAFISSVLDWIGIFTNFITGNATIFVFVVAVPLVALGIALLNRLINTN